MCQLFAGLLGYGFVTLKSHGVNKFLANYIISMVKVVNNKVKRVSKKNKSSWRKHVNIDDVESFLEEKRLEERIGWTDGNDLFEIDNKPTNLTRLTLKQKRRVKLAEIPKCFAMLYPHTKVEDPIKKR